MSDINCQDVITFFSRLYLIILRNFHLARPGLTTDVHKMYILHCLCLRVQLGLSNSVIQRWSLDSAPAYYFLSLTQHGPLTSDWDWLVLFRRLHCQQCRLLQPQLRPHHVQVPGKSGPPPDHDVVYHSGTLRLLLQQDHLQGDEQRGQAGHPGQAQRAEEEGGQGRGDKGKWIIMFEVWKLISGHHMILGSSVYWVFESVKVLKENAIQSWIF